MTPTPPKNPPPAAPQPLNPRAPCKTCNLLSSVAFLGRFARFLSSLKLARLMLHISWREVYVRAISVGPSGPGSESPHLSSGKPALFAPRLKVQGSAV